jgi:hypothetical protein
MAEKEAQMQRDKERMFDKLMDINDQRGHMGTQRYKEMQLAKERGEMIAQLQNKRDILDRDRQRIMEDLEKVKSGDL